MEEVDTREVSLGGSRSTEKSHTKDSKERVDIGTRGVLTYRQGSAVSVMIIFRCLCCKYIL
jgi:hypothetical protein